MSARKLTIILACVSAAALAAPAAGQEGNARKIGVDLTEKAEPDSTPWTDPARISATIDPNGPDSFSAQVNLELKYSLTAATADRQRSLKGYVVWNRETGSDDPQNNFELGGAFTSAFSTGDLDEPEEGAEEAGSLGFDVASRVEAGYARTSEYADLGSAVCVATSTAPQCLTQRKESFRGGASFAFIGPGFERHPKGFLAWSVAPKLGVDYDHLLNDPIDPDTGIRMKGGYLSGLAGVAVSLFPSFDRPRWELSASTQLRQAITVSDSRQNSIKNSAFLIEGAFTYYVIKPQRKDDWRVGIGIAYSRGDDPLTGLKDVNRIVLALRIGHY
jgi:hypothetical protein